MPTLSPTPTELAIKLILVGDSGGGKTGALASLVTAGYELFIADFDGGIDTSYFANWLRVNHPELLDKVHFESFRELAKDKTIPQEFERFKKMLQDWPGAGNIGNWGRNQVLVTDSFSFMCKAAFKRAAFVSTNPDERSWYGDAQDMAIGVVEILTSDLVKCHVICNAHMTFIEATGSGQLKAYPATIGKAIGPEIPKYFNTMLECCEGRYISTQPSAWLNVKHPIATGVPRRIPIETGLADIFAKIQDPAYAVPEYTGRAVQGGPSTVSTNTPDKGGKVELNI